ncbi:Putative NADPH-quinone reductase (modulator of drug activity B) [Tenacibaculum sp. MAR_2009_124]|uniref:NAD(P)H-dependent oxidoreductase n=1 Tax=Tenacibaculum sp. MAR_2009_124 TaxID=1250059 RepID=UPI00089AD524|nr:NAD(P)H-dependent oxidoreductase [Tenacibaculum sp. MAR_2009_124]SEB36481.1 Putative NADPH-quinone reductase (modulator of drug activity B) [Tenacibaculum sp. MAR_2009_124]
MKQVLIINGHPDIQSYNHALSEAYKNGVSNTNAIIDTINISELDFNPNLRFGYRKRTELEPDLKDAIEKLKRADHIVWFFPLWWAGYPAIMKGFIDRTFLPGITFKFEEGNELPIGLLKGKSASVFITSDTPELYDKEVMKQPALNQFKIATLEFCGISPVNVTYISTITDSSEEFRKNWIDKLYRLGAELK